MGLKRDQEGTKAQLDEAKSILEQTEMILSQTKQSLAKETYLREAHEATEEKLTNLGSNLISRLHQIVNDVTALHAKDEYKSDI